MKTSEKADVYQLVTDHIIAKLEQGTIPWRHFASAPLSQPMNLVSKRPYHGINYLLLSHSRLNSPYWLTYNQAQELGGYVRKGEQSELVVFWKWLEVEDKETGETKEIPFLKYYRVFNVEQTEGVNYPKSEATARDSHPIEAAERIVANMPNRPEITLDNIPQAFYQPSTDTVHMLNREQCVSDEQYQSTLFHELVHSTGHKSRLNRFEEENTSHKFGSQSYAKEELVAEMGAGFLCAESGIFQEVEENSAAYIANWLTKLANDKKLVVYAAGKAQKAMDYITGSVKTTDAEQTK
jgi:antirestriction protein ArdC